MHEHRAAIFSRAVSGISTQPKGIVSLLGTRFAMLNSSPVTQEFAIAT